MESLHIVCPQCQGVNRVGVDRLHDNPLCGKCGAKMFAGRAVDVDFSAFKAHIKRNHIPVLIDFWAPWCGPCKVMGPAFTEAAKTLEPFVRLVKVNTKAETSLGHNWYVRSIPTMVLVKEGREIGRQSGAMTSDAIIAWVRSKI